MNDLYQQLLMYNADNYSNYYDAEEEAAVYSTPSTMDNIGTQTGILDLFEIIKCFEELQGGITITAGVLIEGEFVTLKELYNKLEH